MKLSILILTVLFAATSFITTGCKKKEDTPNIDIPTKEVEEAAKDAEKEAGEAAKDAEKALDEIKK